MNIDKSQIRNYRDFLQLYNKLTELCFTQCVDNLFSRNLSNEETLCLENCTSKFTNVNQRIMGSYVEVQTVINERRLQEMEAKAKEIAQAEALVQSKSKETLDASNTVTIPVEPTVDTTPNTT